jgi:serine/threonine protein kinase
VGINTDLTDVAAPCPGCGAMLAPGARCGACAASEDRPLPTGLFPNYLLLRRVGSGGMSEVFEGHRHKFPDDRRALKVLRADLAEAGGELAENFAREAVGVQRVSDPHVVRVFDVGQTTDGRAFVVMEWLEGRTLAAAIEDPSTPWGDPEHPDLPAAVAELASRLGPSLDRLHAANVVHLDLKPSNIVLVDETPGSMRPVLIDFGIAQLTGAAASDTPSSIGTVEHVAPERVRGEPGTAKTDLYLFAHVLYRLLSGLRHTTGQIRPLSKVNPRFGRELGELFTDALAAFPEDRPEGCGVFARRLASSLGEVVERERRTERERAERELAAREAPAREAAAEKAAAEKAAAERAAADKAAAEKAAAEKAAAEKVAAEKAAAQKAAARAAAEKAAAKKAAEKAAEQAANNPAAEKATALRPPVKIGNILGALGVAATLVVAGVLIDHQIGVEARREQYAMERLMAAVPLPTRPEGPKAFDGTVGWMYGAWSPELGPEDEAHVGSMRARLDQDPSDEEAAMSIAMAESLSGSMEVVIDAGTVSMSLGNRDERDPWKLVSQGSDFLLIEVGEGPPDSIRVSSSAPDHMTWKGAKDDNVLHLVRKGSTVPAPWRTP